MDVERRVWNMIPVKYVLVVLSILMVLTACGENSMSGNADGNVSESATGNAAGNLAVSGNAVTGQSEVVLAGEQTKESEAMATYVNITPEEAKTIMDSEEGYVVLDVRTQEEYDEKHIPGAVLLPNTEIEAKAEDMLTDKAQLILVYCRSGRRSKQAAEALVKLGYTNVKEFGGIIDWPYEVE